MIGKHVVIDTLDNFKTKLSLIPSSAIVLIKDVGQIYAHGTYFGAQKTYELLNLEAAGLAPAGGINANGLISNVDSEWVLTVTNGKNPVWKKLPANAFSNDSFELKAATTTDLGGIKVGSVYNGLFSTLTGKHYAVNVDNAGLAYVSVPWDFTDLNVKQTSTSLLNEDFSLLFSHTADDSTHTEGTRKASNLKFNPSTGTLTTTILKGNLDGSYINKLTGYSKASTKGSISTNDSLNTALGKLEYKADVAYDLVDASKPDSTTIDTLREVLNVLSGITDTLTIQGILGNYLPLSGGTLTGSLQFTLNNTNGVVVVGNSTVLPGHIYRGIYETGGNVYDHYYNGNVTADYTYANLRVKSLTGFKVLRFGGNGAFSWDGNDVWHRGNDGHNSGLDADTLDSLHASSFFKLSDGGLISNSSDLNTYTTVGTYSCVSDSSAQSLANCPVDHAFRLVVSKPLNGADYILQELTVYWGSHEYTRVKYNTGLWSAWEQRSTDLAVYKAPSATVADKATTADIASLLKGDWGNPTTAVLSALMYSIITKADAGSLPVNSNANGLLTINTHSGNYYHQLALSSDGNLYHRNFINEALNNTKEWKQIAFTDSTVESANKLSNTVYLWGQAFDGTQNLNGNIRMGTGGGGIGYKSQPNVWTYFPIYLHNEADNKVLFRAGLTGSGDTLSYFFAGPTESTFVINNNSDVGIGTSEPDLKLTVNGGFRANLSYLTSTRYRYGTSDLLFIGHHSSVNLGDPNGAAILAYNNNAIRFYTGSKESLTINSDGSLSNVGAISRKASSAVDVDSLGNLIFKNSDLLQTWSIQNSSGSPKFVVGENGNITTYGLLNAKGNIYPDVTNSYSLGSDSVRWKNVYGKSANFDTSLEVSGLLRITAISGGLYLMMGNQNGEGVNNPFIIEAANGTLYFGNGNSWEGVGGTFSNICAFNSSGIASQKNITAPKFIKSGSSKQYILLGNGDHRSIGDFYDLTGGINIPINSDLNTYTTTGTYYCSYDSDAKTLTNSPTEQAFTMLIYPPTGTTSYVALKIFTWSGGKVYYRVKESGGWNKWILIATDLSKYTAELANKLANTVKLWGKNFDGSSDVSGHLYISNNHSINNYDSEGNSYRTLLISSANEFLIGHDSSQGGIPTYIHGKTVNLRYDGAKEGLILNQLGNVGIGTTTPSYKLQVAGTAYVEGTLLVGNDASNNYMAFYGTTGDGAAGFSHTYIGEHATGTNELSELILYKGNDHYNNGSGPDRIRHIAAQHVFQIYKQAFSGTFINVCTSTVPENILAINHSNITSYVSIIPYAGNSYNLGSSSAYWSTSYCNINICNKLGIGTTPQHALHVKGNSLVEGIFTIKGTNSSFQQLILKNSYTDTVDWDTKIISDYYGSHVYDVDGFRHGLFITLGRENPFDNLYVMDYSGSPITRISKYHGHYFDGNFEVTETIKTKGLFINTSDATLKFYSGKTSDGNNDGTICLQTCFDAQDGETHSYASSTYQYRENIVLLPRAGLVYIGYSPTTQGNTNYKLSVYGHTFSEGYTKKDSSDDYVLLGGGGHKSIADLTLGDNTTEISKSLTVTLNWMDTGIKYNDIPSNGSYIVLVTVTANDSTGDMYTCYFTGMMSWFVDYLGNKTNDSETDEILLHRSGHAYGNTIYLRTVMTSGGASSSGLKLLIAANKNIGKAYTYTFKFKRII